MNRKKILTAGFWVIFIFGLTQLLRLGGNLIVTRLLSPELFGVMAIVWVVLNGLAMLSDLGLRQAVIRNKAEQDSHFNDTIWTMQVIRGWIIFFIVLVGAFTLYSLKNIFGLSLHGVYDDNSLPIILAVVSVISVLKGYVTLAPALLTRALQRGRLELIGLASQVCGMLIMILWAYISPTIWPLVFSGLVTAIVSLVLFYQVFDIRHKLSWDKAVAKEVFNFGKWIFVASALTYIAQQGDRIFFSVYVSPAQLGVYSIAIMLAMMISTIISQLSTKIWYPVFCKKNNELKKLGHVYYKIRTYNEIVSLLVVIVLITWAPSIIDFLYDTRYHDAGWMLQILAISLFGVSITSISNVCLTSLGKTKVQMQVMLIRSIALAATLPLLYTSYGLSGAIVAVAINPYFSIPIQYYWLNKEGILNFKRELITLISIIILVSIGVWLYLGFHAR